MLVTPSRQGLLPFDNDLNPQINNEAGVKGAGGTGAAPPRILYPGARTNGLFENFEAFGQGDKFSNVGWGGTQKYLNGPKSRSRASWDSARRRGHGQGPAAEDALLQLGLELRRHQHTGRSPRSRTCSRCLR